MSVQEKTLWTILEQKAREEDQKLPPDQGVSNQYLSAIRSIYDFGVQRAKTIRDTFPMYTLHDEAHICNVLYLMLQLLGENADRLTRDEAAMLILAASCHDVGMSYSEEEKQQLRQDRDRLDQYLEQHHGEYVKAYRGNSDVPQFTNEMLRKYLRSIHHQRISELLQHIQWPECLRGKVDRGDLIRVCQSHGNSPSSLKDLGCTPTVDLRFCAVLLRLADILDFDTIRAPKAVYDYCGFHYAEGSEAKISQGEWEKHMSSQGFNFAHVANRSVPYDLPYHATSKSMQIEQALNSYLDWVDSELNECGKLLRQYTGKWQDFVLPGKVQRTIETEGYVSGQYHLTMDQDKIMELLVGEELYSDPSAFVRELLQNAIDAVRTREQLDRQLPRNWKPQINIRTWMDEEGYHWFRIEDNGIGMTQEIVENYFLKIGRSYYTSDTFQKEKLLCRADPEYTPISRFGIGILSCFMGGKDSNRVEISTKRFPSDGVRPPALRLSMHGMNGYYYLASQRENHEPGPMKGVTEQEKRPYLQQPGTVVAVRTNLYQTGKYTGFKQIVDRYVIYPPVPIHYDGPEGSFDYATQAEFMEAVHNVHPSDDLSQQGVLEFSLTEEQMQELRDTFPKFQLDAPPKVRLKCVPLDRYTKSPYLSGAVICAETIWTPNSISLFIEHKPVDVDIQANTDWDWKTGELGIHVFLNITDSNGDEMIPPRKPEWLKRQFHATVCHPSEWSWYQKYFLDIHIRTDLEDVAAHNGIFCGGASSFFQTRWGSDNLGSILLFADQYRPGVDISRSGIRNLSLEMACDIELMTEALRYEGYQVSNNLGPLVKDPPWLIPISAYHELVQKRPDLETRLMIDTREGLLGWQEIQEQIEQQKTLCVSWWISHSIFGYWDDHSPMNLNEQFRLACLSRHYDLHMNMDPDWDEIYIREATGQPPEPYRDIFPPSLFIAPETECRYLTRDRKGIRHFCNADHRLSKFMLKNADLMQEKVSGILKEMIRILQEENGEQLISGINDLLACLRNLPGQPIQVPPDLFLTKEDLLYTELDE